MSIDKIIINKIEAVVHADSISPTPNGFILSGSPVRIELPGTVKRFYRHGWQSWSLTAWLDPSIAPNASEQPIKRHIDEDGVYAQALHHISSGVGAVELTDGRVVLLGGLNLEARVEADGQTLKGFYEAENGEWFLASGDSVSVFNAYADLLAARFGRRKTETAPRVWCSWYSLYMFIHETHLLKILRGLSDLPFDVIQIDDGWQVNIGDWEANKNFSSGMAALAEAIRKTGRRAGLWLAPLMARDNSQLYRDHPNWFLKDEHGQPVLAHNNWGGPIYALDTTQPEAVDWLAALIKKIRGWGYDYLKLDFLYGGALPGVRYNDIPREAAYRQAMQVIREAAGDAYILACGAPVIPSIGVCDGLRVGPDTAPYWSNKVLDWFPTNTTAPGAQNALRISLERAWLKPLLHVDPDVAYFRSKHCLLTRAQKTLIQDLGFITGFKACSDLPEWLTPSDREALRAYLESTPTVDQLDRYRFRIDDREVNFNEAIRVAQLDKAHYDPIRVEQLAYYYDVVNVGLPAIIASTLGKR